MHDLFLQIKGLIWMLVKEGAPTISLWIDWDKNYFACNLS